MRWPQEGQRIGPPGRNNARRTSTSPVLLLYFAALVPQGRDCRRHCNMDSDYPSKGCTESDLGVIRGRVSDGVRSPAGVRSREAGPPTGNLPGWLLMVWDSDASWHWLFLNRRDVFLGRS